MGYKINAFKGISWMWGLRGVTRGITFVRLAVLARILSPLQFGVFGIATLVLEFLEILTETGINIVLIQKGDEADDYISSAWIVSIIRGVFISILLLFFAGFISSFFNSADSYSLIMMIGLVPLIRGFINPAVVNNFRKIQFHKEFYFRTILLSVEAFVSVVIALSTKSATSLVLGMIASAITEVILSFVLFKPAPRLEFETEKVKFVFKRGWWVTLTGVMNYFADNGDNITVGKLLSTSSLGYYQMAYNISTLPISEITNVVNSVVFPVYSKFSNDRARLMSAFAKVTISSSFLAFALGLFIFIFPKELITVFLGEKWLPAVPAIRILAFYGVLRTVFGNFSPLVLSIGRQDYLAKTTIIRSVALIVTIVPFTLKFGLVGAAASAFISMFFEIPAILFYLVKIFKRQ